MSKTMQEKRRSPRKTLEKETNVLDNDTGLAIGTLSDVSKGGFSLLTDKGIRPSELRNVTLTLPGPPSSKDSDYKVSMVVECVWCQSVSQLSNFAAGFALRDIQDQDEVALNYYIRDYQVTSVLEE